MYFAKVLFIFSILPLILFRCQASEENFLAESLVVEPDKVVVVLNEQQFVQYRYTENLTNVITITLKSSDEVQLSPKRFSLTPDESSFSVNITGKSVTSRAYVDIAECYVTVHRARENCPFNASRVFVQASVVKSDLISVLVTVTGWIYFVAWSISFYPQIILNFQRKSVIGLNFDFLVLNIIGFTCYTVYNVMLYFDKNVQQIYITQNTRALIPVLFNDVFFAVHALAASIFTAIQCLIYERGKQRVSYICRGWASLLIAFSLISLVLGVVEVINWLIFIKYLSFVKMAVTLSKYFPQAILNFKRKSTIGWSIGNVLLDFTGGFMDIMQMVLQATNTDDWTGFYGNPVKFGLGLVSMLFDIVFIIQHYILYRNSEDETSYDVVGQAQQDGLSRTTVQTTDTVRDQNPL